MKGVRYDNIESLVVTDNITEPSPVTGEVIIRVVCSTANRQDVTQNAECVRVFDDVIGIECSGYVHDVSRQLHTTWKPGDRVMAILAGGGNAEYVAVPEAMLMPVPITMNFSTAAAIPENWVTAYNLIHDIGKVKYRDTVLIHNASSGVGTAAIQMCSIAGAIVYGCVSSDDKIGAVIDLGASNAFNAKSHDFVDSLLKATKGAGINLILDCVGGWTWKENSAIIATDGKWIIYGLQGGAEVSGDILSVFLSKRISLIGSYIRSRSLEYKSECIANFLTTIMPRLENGRVMPIIDRVMPLKDVATAQKILEIGQNYGKIVLQVSANEEQSKSSYRLPDKTRDVKKK